MDLYIIKIMTNISFNHCKTIFNVYVCNFIVYIYIFYLIVIMSCLLKLPIWFEVAMNAINANANTFNTSSNTQFSVWLCFNLQTSVPSMDCLSKQNAPLCARIILDSYWGESIVQSRRDVKRAALALSVATAMLGVVSHDSNRLT